MIFSLYNSKLCYASYIIIKRVRGDTLPLFYISKYTSLTEHMDYNVVMTIHEWKIWFKRL